MGVGMMLDDMPDEQIRLVVVGNPNVGKSTLIRRYLTPSHKSIESASEVPDFVAHITKYNNKKVQLQIWDSTGLEVNQSYFRGAHAIILMFDVSVKKSYDDLATWITKVAQVASPRSYKIIVGNKCDLMVERVISSEPAEENASLVHADYIETSAKENINVSELFTKIMNNVLAEIPPAEPVPLPRPAKPCTLC